MAQDITQLLIEVREGRDDARDRLLPLVYDDLRAMARHRARTHHGDPTLGATALVHEAYLKLFDHTRVTFRDRRHFFAVAAMAMRQIVVDQARRRLAQKRGGGVQPVDIDDEPLVSEDRTEEILSLDEALRRLSQVDERLSRVVELRFFGGLSVDETAEVLGVDGRTVKRDWRKARALLHGTLTAGDDP